ncbi:hypothetical protein JHK85_018816 [Glycine max]|nr:hypothetical protein JHK85_018816 [Glycine max]
MRVIVWFYSNLGIFRTTPRLGKPLLWCQIGLWLSANCVEELCSLRVCEIAQNCNLADVLCLVQLKKRGLSLEQKREKMLPIFYESQDFYLLRNVSCKLDFDLESNAWPSSILILHFHQDERVEAIADLKAIGQKHNELKDELAKYKDNDPVAFEAMS